MRNLVLLLCLAAPCALAQDSAPLEDAKAVAKWMAARAKAAAAGKPEVVRFAMVHHSTWGSDYPTYFIGASLDSAGDAPTCLEPTFAKGAEEPDTLDAEGRDRGRVAIVEGRFTGKTSTQKQSSDPDEKETYTLYGFQVLRHRPARDGEPDAARARIVATFEQATASVPTLSDDRPWIATVDSFPALEKGGPEKASALLEKVKKAGFAKSELIDSRGVALLFCCYQVVIADRFATQDEATALMKDLKKKGFGNAGVRRGW